MPLYNGLEIDMLSVGDGDCLLVTSWSLGSPTRVLIDGGNASNFPLVARWLLSRGIRYLDHAVCTHAHDDHARGLIKLLTWTALTFGKAWLHLPEHHFDIRKVHRALIGNNSTEPAKLLHKTIANVKALRQVLNRRGIPYAEPFTGDQIGPLTVVGPTRAYYGELLCQYEDADRVRVLANLFAESNRADTSLLFAAALGRAASMNSVIEHLPEPDPENNSSVMLATVFDEKLCLLTGDAGPQAFMSAIENYTLSNCYWMQIPHHGSRRNLTPALIDYLRPVYGFVSASGSLKHPRRALVNALKNIGTVVCSTHYPNGGGNLWFSLGYVPPRTDYNPTVPLYDMP
jgi:beta-lactamase superfamily II metal-dependent hydrolase